MIDLESKELLVKQMNFPMLIHSQRSEGLQCKAMNNQFSLTRHTIVCIQWIFLHLFGIKTTENTILRKFRNFKMSDKINWSPDFELNEKTDSWKLLATAFRNFSMK